MMVLWIVLGLFILLIAIALFRAVRFRPTAEDPPLPVPVDADEGEAARNLAALVQCRTVSHTDPALDDEREFDKLVALLPTLFPNVHRVCSIEHIGSRGLLYRWAGKTDGAPLVLTAHYDVVPAEAEHWEKPPFCGEIAEGILFGRGTLDTKCTLSAAVSAADSVHLVSSVPRPKMIPPAISPLNGGFSQRSASAGTTS